MMKNKIDWLAHREYMTESQFAYETIIIRGKPYKCELIVRTKVFSAIAHFIIRVNGKDCGCCDSFKTAVSIWNCLDEYIANDDLGTIPLDMAM